MPRRFQDLLGRISLVGFQDHKEKTRSIIEGDLERVLQIYKQNFEGCAERIIREYSYLFRHIFYIIEDPSHEVVGYCMCYVRLRLRGRHVSKFATIYSIAVDPANHRQGLGAALLEDSINELSMNNVRNIRLFVNTLNTPAIRLYEKYGFEITDTRKNVCGQGKMCHVMELFLNEKGA